MPLIIFLILILFSFSIGGFSLIIWLPARSKDLDRILKLAKLKPNEKFYDLGCGDGRVVTYIAKHTQAQVVGLEIVLPLFLICKFKQILNKRKNLEFKLRNLFKENLSDADVIYIFGIPDKLKNKLRPKFEQELKPGTRVISYAFKIDGWNPDRIDRLDNHQPPIYLYLR